MASNKEKYTLISPLGLEDKKVVCLTLDVEQDYGDLLQKPSYEGLQHISELVDFFLGMDIPLTCFVQGSLLETHGAQIEQLFNLNVEFELHSYSHLRQHKVSTKFEIERGKDAYRRFFGKEPVGYRSSLGVTNGKHYEILASNGFRFDSSVFPTLRPGAFNNLRKPTKPYLVDDFGVVEFPFTVFSDIIRVPIGLSYIKLLGRPYLYLLKKSTLPNLIVFGFHMHDLFQLNSTNEIPIGKSPFIYRRVFKRIYQGSKDGLAIMGEVINLFQKRNYAFLRLIDVYHTIPQEKLTA